jgi:putative ABC transport system ATP-binding protein
VVAVHDVTCEVTAAHHVAVSGPSGSGKSTLLHLFAGLTFPTTGTVSWPALGPSRELRPSLVGVVFQGPSLIPELDVTENVALPLLLGGADDSVARTAAGAALAGLGLTSLAERLPDELSGGQAQRVAVARVLAGRPRLILADEPTGQLNHAVGEVVIGSLIRSARHLGAALVVTTHDPAVASRFPVRWTMTDGRLVELPHEMTRGVPWSA